MQKFFQVYAKELGELREGSLYSNEIHSALTLKINEVIENCPEGMESETIAKETLQLIKRVNSMITGEACPSEETDEPPTKT